MGIRIKQKGDFSKSIRYMTHVTDALSRINFDQYGEEGVRALTEATPKKTGKTAESWGYRVKRRGSSVSLEFINSNNTDGIPVAILIFYGHGTRNGGYVEGIDYINPALEPIFKKLSDDIQKELNGNEH